MRLPTIITPQTQQRLHPLASLVALAGGVVLLVSAFLPWAYSSAALDDMTILGYPSTLQIFAALLGVIVAVCSFLGRKAPKHGRRRIGWARGAKAASVTALVYVIILIAAIGVELGGLVNVVYGGWVAVLGALVAFAGTRLTDPGRSPNLAAAKTPAWAGILAIALAMAAVLYAAFYGLDQDDPGTFVAFIAFAIGIVTVLFRLGVMSWLSAVTARHRKVLIFAAFLTAFAFPFTQNGSDENMSIATQVLIFAATALGLNIVVGLAGLLDLGYIAFLGAGAFTAAILSESVFSTVKWHPPFIVVVLISGAISGTLGLIIGTPTLRVSGDYLAIVTLAFGEIFRFGMINLDGTDGPDLTNGSNGIPGVPDLNLFGFDFKNTHTIFGIAIGRFANYYFLLLVLIAIIILIFARLNNSRIGRGWVAIREDEKAAEAMGVNVFGLKLFAFASGAFLAGVAGSIKAHHDVSVTPDQYIFLESAFLLAAVVLGGMGTILGVLVGATLLKLMPEKLRFVNEYRLLIFGLLLVIMMRFRPEGLVASKRRQLEFHEDDEEMAEKVQEAIDLQDSVSAPVGGRS